MIAVYSVIFKFVFWHSTLSIMFLVFTAHHNRHLEIIISHQAHSYICSVLHHMLLNIIV